MKLMCGDCLELMKEIPAGSVDMILTDPPYGTTACKWDSIIPLEPMWEQLKRVIKPNGAIVMTASQPFTTTLIGSNLGMFRYCWYWEKSRPTGFQNARFMPLKNIEDVCVFSFGKPNPAAKNKMEYHPIGVVERKAKKSRKKPRKETVNRGENDGSLIGDYLSVGEKYPRQIIKIGSEGRTTHPTQKPVALMEYLIKTYTNEGETVLDFTMGSGSTGVACVNTNRDFIGIELDENYFKIAEKRIKEAQSQGRLF